MAEALTPTVVRDEDHAETMELTESRLLTTVGRLRQGLGQDSPGCVDGALGAIASLARKNLTSSVVELLREQLARAHRANDRLGYSSSKNVARGLGTARDDVHREVTDHVSGLWRYWMGAEKQVRNADELYGTIDCLAESRASGIRENEAALRADIGASSRRRR